MSTGCPGPAGWPSSSWNLPVTSGLLSSVSLVSQAALLPPTLHSAGHDLPMERPLWAGLSLLSTAMEAGVFPSSPWARSGSQEKITISHLHASVKELLLTRPLIHSVNINRGLLG